MLRIWIGLMALTLAVLGGRAWGADWPQFRGLRRDGKSPETGLLKRWPAQGPRLLMTIGGLGRGYSSPVVVKNRIYATGMVGKNLKIFCFNLKNEKIWESDNGPEFSRTFPGSRGTPTVDRGILYSLSGNGRLAAYACSNGKELWNVNIMERFQGVHGIHGYTESPLVDGDMVICLAGGPHCMVALNRRTGKTLWTSRDPIGRVSYSSATAFTCKSERLITATTTSSLVCLRARDGKLMFKYDRPELFDTNGQIAMNPIYDDGLLFAGCGFGPIGCAFQLDADLTACTAKKIWESNAMKCYYKSYLLVNHVLYGSINGDFCCLDFRTGKGLMRAKGAGSVNMTWADGMFYCLTENGRLRLVEENPREYKLISEFKIPNAGSESWSSPVISDGKLYVRRCDKLFVYKAVL